MFTGLSEFLKSRRKKNGETHTHTVYGGGDYGGSYTIPEHDMEEFYKLIYKCIFKKNENFSIVEKIQDVCPLIVDYDFKYKDKEAYITEGYKKKQMLRKGINNKLTMKEPHDDLDYQKGTKQQEVKTTKFTKQTLQ